MYGAVAEVRNDTLLASVTGNGHTYRVFYDALGRCVVRTMDGSTSCYVYDGEKPIVEYGPAFAKTATNIYGRGIDEILQRTDFTITPNRLFYYQDDHEGNVTHLMMVVNSVPTVVESYRYDAFGKPAITNTSGIVTNNRFMFTGREYVSQFGIYEYRNRAYHPGLGRFMSEDPKLFVRRAGLGEEPDNWSFGKYPDEGEMNLFRYCGNDPVDYSDPMGLYVTYSEGWSAADAANYRQEFAKQWAKPEQRKEIEKAYADVNEHQIFPDRSSGSYEKGATKFWDVTLTKPSSKGEALKDALSDGWKILTGTLEPRPPKNFLPPTNKPQLPPDPSKLPKGWHVRQSGPNQLYKNGSWRLYNARNQPVNPSTMKPPSNVTKPQFNAETHVEFPGP